MTQLFDPVAHISPVVREMTPSGIRKFFELAATTKDVISLGVGEPDFVTPWHIREACFYALEKGYTMYTSNLGLPELRVEISRYLEQRFGLSYDPAQEILVTVGASEAVDLALRALISPGTEVLVPEPCYVAYKPCVILAGGTPVSVPTSFADGFTLKAEELRKYLTPRTRVLILSYPNNPTGSVLSYGELQKLSQVINEHDLVVVADEIYAELTYERQHVSIASMPGMLKRTILINGFSKAFAMTGWRLGYAAACREFIEAMLKIHQYTMLCAPITAQMAAIEALRNGLGDVETMREQYNYRRRLMLSRLRDMGLCCPEPKGAFYVFPSIANTGLTSEQFAERLLKEEGVAVVPGSVFGAGGEGHIRCSYAASMAQLLEALKRMERFVQKLEVGAA